MSDRLPPPPPISGMTHAPQGTAKPVVQPGEFVLAAAYLDHGHIYGMVNGLIEAGAQLKWVLDAEPQRITNFLVRYPGTKVARSLDEILDDPAVQLVASAAVPCERGAIGCRIMSAGKDYFCDKAPFTELSQLAEARRVVASTRKKYAVYYSERIHVECAVLAGRLIQEGRIGRVVQVMGLGPHRLNKASRPDWFFEREKYGGILCDIGSHQIEQFLYFSGAQDAQIQHAAVGNFCHPDKPELEDFGEALLLGDNGTSNYIRVDWLTPDGLSTWGDGRTLILGTTGYIELRKYVDLAASATGDHLLLVDGQGEYRYAVKGRVGFPYFGELILDCLQRTEHAMSQEHAFKAAELCLIAQAQAQRMGPVPAGSRT
jgi:predicted dehydrogenase